MQLGDIVIYHGVHDQFYVAGPETLSWPTGRGPYLPIAILGCDEVFTVITDIFREDQT